MAKRIVGIGLLIVLTGVIFSCRTSSSTKIIGTWKYIPYSEPNDSIKMFWDFYAGDYLKIRQIKVFTEKIDTTEFNFAYSISGNVLDVYLNDTLKQNTILGDVTGEYWVDKLNADYFTMTRKKLANGESTAAYLRVELAKQ